MSLENYSTEQLEKILQGAPDGAEYWETTKYAKDLRANAATEGVCNKIDYTHCYAVWCRFLKMWDTIYTTNNVAKSLIKLSDIRAYLDQQSNNHQIASDCNLTSDGAESAQTSVSDELKLKPSIQTYFNSDERGSIEQEQSVIERFTNLAESFREIGKQFQSPRSIERGIWIAAAMYIERELKEVAGDE